MDVLALGILVTSLLLAFLGIYFWLDTRKKDPKSIRETSQNLLFGIIAGSIVAVAVLAGELAEEAPSGLIPFVLCFALSLIVFLIGLAFVFGADKLS